MEISWSPFNPTVLDVKYFLLHKCQCHCDSLCILSLGQDLTYLFASWYVSLNHAGCLLDLITLAAHLNHLRIICMRFSVSQWSHCERQWVRRKLNLGNNFKCIQRETSIEKQVYKQWNIAYQLLSFSGLHTSWKSPLCQCAVQFLWLIASGCGWANERKHLGNMVKESMGWNP